MKKTNGFTLLELMIALVLGLFILGGIFDMFDAARQSYRYTEGLALIQENGQLASYILTRELSRAGYAGCRKIDPNFPLQSHIATMLDPTVLVHGYNQQDLPSSEKNISQNMVTDSAVVAVQYMNTDTASLAKAVQNSAQLSINAGQTFATGDEIMIADCAHADVASIVDADKQALRLNAPVRNYEAGAQVGKWSDEWFYVEKTTRINQAGHVLTVLYMHQPNGQDEEVIDNVANMHVQYGYITKGGDVKFIPASQVADWSAIKALRIILLLSSGEPVLSQVQKVKFDGHDWQPPDRQLYKQWEVVVALLNR